MAVLTRDIIINGYRRDDVFKWMSEFETHALFLKEGFPNLVQLDSNTLSLPFFGGYKQRTLIYRFIEADDRHEGRRIKLETDGKRLKGSLHYSLRTVKPSTNTMVTVHMDYDAGSVLGKILQGDLEQNLATCLVKSLESLKKQMEDKAQNTP